MFSWILEMGFPGFLLAVVCTADLIVAVPLVRYVSRFTVVYVVVALVPMILGSGLSAWQYFVLARPLIKNQPLSPEESDHLASLLMRPLFLGGGFTATLAVTGVIAWAVQHRAGATVGGAV